MSAKRKYRNVNDFLQYLKGALSNRERHSFERDLESDPFAREALEGLETLSPEQAEEDLLELHSRLRQRLARKEEARKRLARKRRIAIYSAAAVVASLLIVGTVFLQLYDFSPEKAEESLYEREYPAVPSDKKEEPEARPVPEEEPARHPAPSIETGKKALPETADRPAQEKEAAERAAQEERAAAGTAREERVARAPEPQDRIVHEEALSPEPAAGIQGAQEPVEARAAMPGPEDVPAEKDEAARRKLEAIPAEEQAFQAEPVEQPARLRETAVSQPVAMKQKEMKPAAMQKGTFPEEEALAYQADEMVSETVSHVVVVGEDLEPVEKTSRIADLEDQDVTEPVKNITAAIPSTGYEAYKNYVRENLHFPPEDTITKRAVVVLQFTVSAEGELRDIRAMRSPGDPFTRQAEQLLLEGPSWDPAKDRQRNIDDQVRLRFVFRR